MDLKLFENNSIKIAGILYSLIVTFLTTPVFLSIISYEQNHYRYQTLINQLLTKLAKCALLMNILVQLPNTLLYIFGPFPWYICYPLIILFPILASAFILLVNAITIVRYFFIFLLKNPTSLQDSFWVEFIFSWALMASTLGNIAFFLLPGKNPNMLYICMGSAPLDYINYPSKSNYFMLAILIVSIVIQIFVNIKQILYLKFYNNNQVISIRENENTQLDLVTFLFTFFSISTVFLFFLVSIVLNNYTLQELTEYPKYLLLYVFHLITEPTFFLLFICFLFQKDRKMLRYVKNELSETIFNWRMNVFNDQVFTVNF